MGNTKMRIDLTNMEFGYLKVLHRIPSRDWEIYWKCLCVCGKVTDAATRTLNKGRKKSCGCKRGEMQAKAVSFDGTHHLQSGKNETRTYTSWVSMRNRCRNPNIHDYNNYGGRGIKVCERWENSFTAFLKDMGERPVGTSIDRIDVNGNYEPGNCKWSTSKEQSNNKRKKRAS